MKKDLIGRRFGRLVAIKPTGKHGGYFMWLCHCDCGGKKVVRSTNLLKGATLSCGCLNKERTRETRYKHGKEPARLYRIWSEMKRRCYDEKRKDFKNYGARGITVCDEWRNSFEAFRDWALAHGYEDTRSIDRIDVSGNYEPSNCRWATMKEQARNKRTNHKLLGKCIEDWAKSAGVTSTAIKKRLHNGWPLEEALNTPRQYNHRRKNRVGSSRGGVTGGSAKPPDVPSPGAKNGGNQ